MPDPERTVDASPSKSELSLSQSEGWFTRVRRWDWETIALVLGIKVLVLSFGLQAVASVEEEHPGWDAMWNHWDANHYIGLAKHGYHASGDQLFSLVFFPLYPWFV